MSHRGRISQATCHDAFVEPELVARATAAVSSLARENGLRVDEVEVLQNSNALALRLLPCDVFARTARVGQEVAAFEVVIARELAALSAPVASLDPRVEPRAYHRDGFVVTFWTYYDAVTDTASPAEYAAALQRLHRTMRGSAVDTPHVTERIASAERLLTNGHDTPDLADADRTMLLDALRDGRRAMSSEVGADADQLLHGEPHSHNLLVTREGVRFIDFETCCRGPVEFDVAHAPDDACARYPGLDQTLLQECRRVVLAMVAAWRWDVRDEFPNGRRYGRIILDRLRAGPPWPAVGPPPGR